ncbi:MAG: thermonuclease family protein [Chloroflexi bacterium]|nr:thermonuclease family protein [Chloroflexota bacterium]
MFNPVRLILLGIIFLLAACGGSGSELLDPNLETGVKSTISAQASVFEERDDPVGTPSTSVFCQNCELIDVLRIVDGETIETELGRIRLFGADAPGFDEECGTDAFAFISSIVSRKVGIKYGPPLRDEYSTSRAYVYDSIGNSLDLQLIANGLATVRRRGAQQLPGPYQSALIAVENKAKNSSTGCLWKNFIPLSIEPTGPELTATAAVELTQSAAILEEMSTSIPVVASATTGPTSSPLPATPETLPTVTPVSPSATSVPPTPLPIPPTATPVPPTPTPLPTATPEPTATVVPTNTPTITPTPTHTPTVTPIPTPRITISTGTTPSGAVSGATHLTNARVIFDEPVGVISAKVKWTTGGEFELVTVIQVTGEIIASHVYLVPGVYLVEIRANTDQGDTATASINALVN